MKFRKTIIVVMTIICLALISGCGNKNEGAKQLWENYVSAVNAKNREKITACYYPEGASTYKAYLEKEENFDQFSDIDKIATKTFEFTTEADLSSSAVNQLYYSAHVTATVTQSGTPYDIEFDVYMSQTNENPWVFTSTVYINPDYERLGNLPDDLWLKTALHVYEDFEYRPSYKLEPDKVTYSNIAIVNYAGKERTVTIPDEIDGLPVTTIKKFAFARFGKIFQITYPASTIRELTIGNNVKLSHGVTFITHDGGVHVLRNICNNPKLDYFGKITIGNNVFIGNKATIMPGVTIGNNVIVGLGSIVTKDIPDNSVVAGVPARIIESIDQYKKKKIEKTVETKLLSNKEKREYLKKIYKF